MTRQESRKKKSIRPQDPARCQGEAMWSLSMSMDPPIDTIGIHFTAKLLPSHINAQH